MLRKYGTLLGEPLGVPDAVVVLSAERIESHIP